MNQSHLWCLCRAQLLSLALEALGLLAEQRQLVPLVLDILVQIVHSASLESKVREVRDRRSGFESASYKSGRLSIL